jgi:glycerol-3-phosphate cytidylyltransferase-like family protein
MCGYCSTLHVLEYVSGCKKVNPDIFVVGEDWEHKPHNIDVEEYLKNNDCRIVQVSYNPLTSSTKIKQNIIAQFHRGKYLSQEI